MTAPLRPALLISALMLLWSAAKAEKPPGPSFVEEPVPLSDNELRQITVDLLERYPELAGSPGAKVAVAYQGGSGTSVPAIVIYYPHVERGGVKEALQARCRRTNPSTIWTCDEVEIRR